MVAPSKWDEGEMQTTKKPRTPVSTKDRRAGERTRWETMVGVYFVLFPLLTGMFLSVQAARAMSMSEPAPAHQVTAVAP
jgi:hypothetical protein